MKHPTARSSPAFVPVLRALVVLAALILCACTAQHVIYEGASPFGAIIVTESPDGFRTLLFDRSGARQSVVKPGDPDHLELPYARTVLVGLALCAGPRRILVVGLGGGTLPGFFHRHYPEALIDVAEINPDVIDVAKKFFGFREDERLRVRLGDGREYIESAGQLRYDLVVLDAFGNDSVPAHLTTQQFLQAVRGILAPDGVAIANVWNRAWNPLHDDMVRTYMEVFDELYVLEVPGDVNTIVLALPRRRMLGKAELAAMARELAARKGFRYELGALVESGFVPVQSYRAGSVLRDPAR